jgi:hypothetical protein
LYFPLFIPSYFPSYFINPYLAISHLFCIFVL